MINRNKKFHFTGFCIDTNFWKIDQSVDKKNNQILFVGNDGNRNISLLLNLIDKMKSYDFLVISNLLEQQINKKNLRIINGNWNSKDISDYDLKKHYKESLITIIPLNNSYQPSGQSVALQSMSQGTPVFISKTKGFWEPDPFKNNEKKINETVNDQKLMNFISESSVKKINDEYNLSVYYSKIKKIIDI